MSAEKTPVFCKVTNFYARLSNNADTAFSDEITLSNNTGLVSNLIYLPFYEKFVCIVCEKFS